MDGVGGMEIAAIFARLLEQPALIVPLADACLGLPRMGQDLAAEPALDIGDDRLAQIGRHVLDVENGVGRAMAGQPAIIKIRADRHPAPAERQK